MSRPILSISGDQTIKKAAEIMYSNDIGSLVVTQDGEFIGIVTERDIVIGVAERTLNRKLKDAARKDLITINKEASLGEAAEVMLKMNIRRLVVTNGDNNIVGILNIRDLTEAVHDGILALLNN